MLSSLLFPFLLSSLTFAAPTYPASHSVSTIPSLPLPLSKPPGNTHTGRANTGSEKTLIEFETCESNGRVSEISISPCETGLGTWDSPCEFTRGSTYTITLLFTSPTSSSSPRANLIAYDPSHSFESSDHYPYSGQSFDACRYTACPIPSDELSEYTYEFKTLGSDFDELTFNVTDGLQGESLFCAVFPIKFIK